MKYSYYPLQRILNQHPDTSKLAFLDTSFEFRSNQNDNGITEVMVGNIRLHSLSTLVKINEDEIINKIDFSLTIEHNVNINQLSCVINASLDLFDIETIQHILQRFHFMLEQLFNTKHMEINKPLYELSLVLPDDRLLMNSLNNTQMLFPSMTIIHHKFVCQVMKHPQKLAVELDDQSLTYAELLHYVQQLALNLLNIHHISRGEIVCQCVKRSLSMVSSYNKYTILFHQIMIN